MFSLPLWYKPSSLHLFFLQNLPISSIFSCHEITFHAWNHPQEHNYWSCDQYGGEIIIKSTDRYGCLQRASLKAAHEAGIYDLAVVILNWKWWSHWASCKSSLILWIPAPRLTNCVEEPQIVWFFCSVGKAAHKSRVEVLFTIQRSWDAPVEGREGTEVWVQSLLPCMRAVELGGRCLRGKILLFSSLHP